MKKDKYMLILHIAKIKDDTLSGVNVVVPQYLSVQRNFVDVALINVNHIKISSVANQIKLQKPFDLQKLQKPYNSPDLVIFQEAYRFEYLQISRNLRKNKIPYIIIPHGELEKESQKKKKWKKYMANLLFFNSFIDHAVAVQCLSDFEYGTTNFGKKKFIGTNGVFIPKQRKKIFRKKNLKFCYIGRLEVYIKGLDILISAFGSMAEFLREEGITLNIYGPDYKGRWEQVKKLIQEKMVEDIVLLHHEVRGVDKEKVLLDTDIFIQTSRHEGRPLGILEALSYGIPCLVTKGTTLGEVIEEYSAGWLAENSIKSVSEKIKEAVGSRRLEQYSNYAAKLAEDKFSWETIMADTVKEYQKIVSEQ